MQAVLPRWKNALILKRICVQSTTTTSTATTHFASFHSTAPSLEKRKDKWNYSNVRSSEQPTKNYIRYAIRQKRADAKKALKDLLFRSGASNISFEKEFPESGGRWDTEEADNLDNKPRSKSDSRRNSKAKKARRKLKLRREKFFDDFEEDPNVFHATFGNKWYSWSFRTSEDPTFQGSTPGFEWRGRTKWSEQKIHESDMESETDSDDEPCAVGSDSDRLVLGLPMRGPLKIDDVKNAFRLAALKWHPDRHQGPTQATAEEKFKRCVNAYKSLCDALSAA